MKANSRMRICFEYGKHDRYEKFQQQDVFRKPLSKSGAAIAPLARGRKTEGFDQLRC
jgi:hypothetical protein